MAGRVGEGPFLGQTFSLGLQINASSPSRLSFLSQAGLQRFDLSPGFRQRRSLFLKFGRRLLSVGIHGLSQCREFFSLQAQGVLLFLQFLTQCIQVLLSGAELPRRLGLRDLVTFELLLQVQLLGTQFSLGLIQHLAGGGEFDLFGVDSRFDRLELLLTLIDRASFLFQFGGLSGRRRGGGVLLSLPLLLLLGQGLRADRPVADGAWSAH